LANACGADGDNDPVRLCRNQNPDQLGDADRLIAAVALDRRLGGEPRALLRLLDAEDAEARAQAAAGRHRRGEPHFVAAVIEPRGEALDAVGLLAQPRQQRQGQESMGDGRAERRRLGARGIDMDPLEIAGRLGEAVDHRLIDRDPIAGAERAVMCGEGALQRIDVGKNAHAISLPGRTKRWVRTKNESQQAVRKACSRSRA
jgi:hypothetical protein